MIRILRYNDKEEWRSLLAHMNTDDVYFSPEYLRLNENILDGELECCVYQGAGQHVVYPYLKRPIDNSDLFDITSAYGFGGYVRSPADASMAGFHDAFCRYCRETGIVSEFIRFHPLLENHAYAEHHLLQVLHRQPVVTVDYDADGSAFRNRMTKEARKKIRKARNNHVEVVEDVDGNYLPEFIDLYKQTMDFKCASDFYFFPTSFFSELQRLLAARSLLFVALYMGDVVGGLLVLHSDRFAYNFLSGSRPEHRKLGTNDMLQFRALEWAHQAGMKSYLLGGGLEGEDSLFRFKAKFSPERKGFFIGERIHLPRAYDDLSRITLERGGDDPEEAAARSWFPLYRSTATSYRSTATRREAVVNGV